jgi:hypothetical protein
MAVSNWTSREIAKVLRKHLPDEKIIDILFDLKNVPGNKSFVKTIENVTAEFAVKKDHFK